MKVVWFAALFAVLVLSVLLLAGQVGLLQGRKPSDLGVHQGRLKPPSNNPNSVSSQADLHPNHAQRAYANIAAFQFSGDGEVAIQKLAEILKNSERTTLVTQQPDYLYAQCVTPIMKFTDDIEFWLDRSAKLIHVRSASRLGRKDFHVNRQRVEAIRAQFNKN